MRNNMEYLAKKLSEYEIKEYTSFGNTQNR